MDRSDLVSNVHAYLSELDVRWFPKNYIAKSSILLSGSTGWGISEGFDSRADWDIHIILDNLRYVDFAAQYGPHHVIDDAIHTPHVFAQIHPVDWLDKRLNQQDTSVLYLWIYQNGTWIVDNLDIVSKVNKASRDFESSLEAVAKKSFIRFSVRRLDASSSAKRRLACSTGIYRGEMVEAALRTYCIACGSPYPYSKWLAKYVEMLGGSSLLALCQRCLFETNLEHMTSRFKRLKNEMEQLMLDKFGNRRWITHWWEFNEN